MNYYPYYPIVPARPSIFGFFKNLNFGSILSGTQKALNLANQAIPLIKQASPMVQNAKTMFKVMNEFRKTDKGVNKVSNIKRNVVKEVNDVKEINHELKNNDGPTFFV